MTSANIAPDIDINRATLAQLSLTAAEIWDSIEDCPEDADLTQWLDTLLSIQNATETKVDAIAYVADQLKLDLETWKYRLERVSELHSSLIQRRRNQLNSLKSYLLRLHKLGLLPNRVVGTERRIDFQNNAPSVVLQVEPEQLPLHFQEVKLNAKNKEILAAHKAGKDVSEFAQIVIEKHVRFRHVSPSRS